MHSLIIRNGDVFLPDKNKDKYLGRIQNSVFHCKRNSQIHYFRNYSGYGFNAELPELDAIEYFHIHLSDQQKELWISKDNLLKNGIRRRYNGYEEQYILNLEYFKPTRPEAENDNNKGTDKDSTQLNLFSEVC